MTIEEAYEAGCHAGWTHALLKVLWMVKHESRPIEEAFRELIDRGPTDPVFGLPKTIVTEEDAVQ